MGAADLEYHLHKSYWTQLEPLEPADVDDLHSLSVAVNWPHRPQDIAFLLMVGRGFIARDQIDRPLGAGMRFEYGTDAAMVGMMITHPKLQAGGLGREILTALEAKMAGRRLRLNATKSAWRLYRSAGFRETGSVVQYQGMCRPGPLLLPPSAVRSFTPEDLPAIEQLDQRVFGASRPDILAKVLSASDCLVLEEGRQVTGFAMSRPFGRGHLIGPLVATSDTDALAMVETFLSRHEGRFVRLDADARHTVLGQYLNGRGLDSYDTVVPMTKGQHFGPEAADEYVYVLASQALG